MKKLLFLVILLVGCSKSNVYDMYVEKLKDDDNISRDIPFNIEFNIDNVNDNRIIYQVIIDEPKVEATNVKALVIHDVKTKDIFPSVGIVDEPIDLQKEKGIILIGYVDQTDDINFKLLIETEDNQYIYEYNYWQLLL